MNTVVVFCHPVPDSFGAFLRDRILERLGDGTHLVDLYDGAEDPAAFEPGHVPSGADSLVLVYPTWWSSLPAPLMGWLETALESDSLSGIGAVVAVSTHGSSRMVAALTGGIGRRIVRRGLRPHLAPGARTSFIGLYSMDRIADDRRRRFAEASAERVAQLVSAG